MEALIDLYSRSTNLKHHLKINQLVTSSEVLYIKKATNFTMPFHPNWTSYR